MSNFWIKYCFSTLAILSLQIFILDKFNPGFSLHIMIYPMLIIALPFHLNSFWLMIIGFVFGFCIDFCTNNFGLYASSCVLIGYLRISIYKFITPRDGYDYILKPTIKDMGYKWYSIVTFIILSINNLWFFIIESLNLYDFWYILQKSILSIITSFFIIVTIQVVFFKATKK